PLVLAAGLRRRRVDAGADPRLRDRLRPHSTLASGRRRGPRRGADDVRAGLGRRAVRAGAPRRAGLPALQLLAADRPGARRPPDREEPVPRLPPRRARDGHGGNRVSPVSPLLWLHALPAV